MGAESVSFNTIPMDIRTPGQYIEVDNTKAVRGLPSINRRMLYIGNKLAAGTAVAATLYRINSPSAAAGLFGRGSVLHEMLVAARAANKESDIWAMALADEGAGVLAGQQPAMGGAQVSAAVGGLRRGVGFDGMCPSACALCLAQAERSRRAQLNSV